MAQTEAVVVVETWRLKPEHAGEALHLMQQMDDLLGPGAHDHAGWCGHARFFQRAECPQEVWMMYAWSSEASHRDLLAKEEGVIAEFMAQYCSEPRQISYFNELPVDTDASMEMAS
ncbi:MAG: hypothetical protein ACPGUV_07340 [Polyangiales bacterium]